MKVAVSVHGRFHAFELARQLSRHGALQQVMTTYPTFAVRRFVAEGMVDSAPGLEAWRRLDGRVPFLPPSQPGLSRAFGRFAARRLARDIDLLVGWSSATLEAIPAARDRGAAVVLERGSCHIAHQVETLREEYARLGLGAEPTPPELIERELAEYEQVDAIAVPSAFAARTFLDRGIAGNRLIVNPLGADIDAGAGVERAERDRRAPEILFVGQVGVRKGTVWLLRAFAPLAGRARLRLVGPLERGFEGVLRREPLDGVSIVGPLKGSALRDAYARADLFCLPSVEEGFGMVILEAMAAGLPVVASDVSGGAEAIADGVDGRVVAARDVGALTGALAALAADGPARRAMGLAAREKVRSRFTWSAYGDRAVAAYESLLARRKGAP